ncbi:hypothetical protein DZG01_07650 [Pseudomonas fluorescens]|nr:hypothetical protein DZG01_07650 [Pseudomonas fluorescens]
MNATPVGASLLAMAVGPPALMSTDPTLSRAGSLPQLDRIPARVRGRLWDVFSRRNAAAQAVRP